LFVQQFISNEFLEIERPSPMTKVADERAEHNEHERLYRDMYLSQFNDAEIDRVLLLFLRATL
jgi:hypothetical protein